MGVLIEHYAGAFPTWLAPVQIEVMSISEKHVGYARKIYDIFIDRGIRAKLNIENEKIGYKIRQSTIEKVPYMLILGDKEAETNKITVRRRNGENFELIDPEKFIEFITKEIKTKKQNLEVVQ
jgi:threonyl-tRNA synthetase